MLNKTSFPTSKMSRPHVFCLIKSFTPKFKTSPPQPATPGRITMSPTFPTTTRWLASKSVSMIKYDDCDVYRVDWDHGVFKVGYKSRQSINRQSVYRMSTYRKMLICRHVKGRLSTVCQYFYSPKLLSLWLVHLLSGRTFPNSAKSYGISYPF